MSYKSWMRTILIGAGLVVAAAVSVGDLRGG
jgi:hypothetical protein